MKRFSKILFSPLGTATDAPSALEDTVALADRNDASLTLVGVVPDPPIHQRGLRVHSSNEKIADLLAADLTERLDSWIEPFTGNRIDTKVLVGNPPIEIVRHVIANEHDLLVVATDGSDSSAAKIRRLLRLCPIPVWVLRPGHEGGRVLAAIDPDDDPDLNEAILQLAQSQAGLRDGELHIAHAWELFGEAALAGISHMPVPGPVLARLADETESAHHRAFSGVINDASIGSHEEHFVNGTPIHAIIGLINLYRIDLLVMGSVGRAGLEGLVVGNTAEELFAKVDCSVLVLKPSGFRSPVKLLN